MQSNPKYKNRRIPTILLAFVSALSACSVGPVSMRVELIDSGSGEPTAASISITDESGNPLEIEGPHSHVRYLDRRWCYVDGVFVVRTLANQVHLDVRRGPETVPVSQAVQVSEGPVWIQLRRWIEMNERGYSSGDGHVHFLSLEDSHLQMRAEDLDTLSLLTGDFTDDTEKFSGRLASVSTQGHEVFVGQEFRDWDHGHVNFLGIQKLVEPIKPFGGRGERNLLLASALVQARSLGASVTWAHFSNLPGLESPIDLALGLIHAVELIAYDDPTELPSHWGPWTNSEFSQAEFPVLRGMDLYYQYLNAGFRLPITAGTDKMGDNIPVGSNRLYVRTDGRTDYQSWLEGLRAGNGFVTNGPILEFEVEGHQAGEVVRFDSVHETTAKVTARSLLPFGKLEIVVNGRAVNTTLPPSDAPTDGIYSAQLESKINLDSSCWVAARVVQEQGGRQRILPRQLTVFAHTNPVYFLRNGKKVRQEASIRYLQKYADTSLRWMERSAYFSDSETKKRALELAKKAVDIYKGL